MTPFPLQRMKIVTIALALSALSGLEALGEVVPLYFVDTNTEHVAQMALDVHSESYPPTTSYTNYLGTLDRSNAESIVANAIRLYITDDFSGFVALHDQAERADVTAETYAFFRSAFSNANDAVFQRCYWIGRQKLITYRMNYSDGPGILGDFWGNKLNDIQGDYYLSTRLLDPITGLLQMHLYSSARGRGASLAASYHYNYVCPPANGHPLKVLFNGTAMRLLMETNTTVGGELESFMKNLVLAFRSGSTESRLAFWTGREREELESSPSLLRDETARFNASKTYLIFVIDFGPNAVLYYQNVDDGDENPPREHQGVDFLTVVKRSDGNYYITEKNLEPQQFFSDNLRAFLGTADFRSFILQKAPP